MMSAESVIEQFKQLPGTEQERVYRELRRLRLRESMHSIAQRPETPLPLSDEEIDELVHASRREMLRARGL